MFMCSLAVQTLVSYFMKLDQVNAMLFLWQQLQENEKMVFSSSETASTKSDSSGVI